MNTWFIRRTHRAPSYRRCLSSTTALQPTQQSSPSQHLFPSAISTLRQGTPPEAHGGDFKSLSSGLGRRRNKLHFRKNRRIIRTAKHSASASEAISAAIFLLFFKRFAGRSCYHGDGGIIYSSISSSVRGTYTRPSRCIYARIDQSFRKDRKSYNKVPVLLG